MALRYASSGNCLDCFVSIKNKTSATFNTERSHKNSALAIAALTAGNTTYAPETPCKNGHYLRYVGSNNCVTCNNETEKARSEDGYHRWARIQKEYGLSRMQFYELWESQNRACVICKNIILEEKKCHIDHSHKTGVVRGILCGTCNQGLGLFKENIDLLNSAVSYIKKYETT